MAGATLPPVTEGRPQSARGGPKGRGVSVSQPQDGVDLDALQSALVDADEQDLDRRLALLRSVEAGLSQALEGLDGL
jgi:hypothetical protein